MVQFEKSHLYNEKAVNFRARTTMMGRVRKGRPRGFPADTLREWKRDLWMRLEVSKVMCVCFFKLSWRYDWLIDEVVDSLITACRLNWEILSAEC